MSRSNEEILEEAIRKAIDKGWNATLYTFSKWLPEDYAKNIAEQFIHTDTGRAVNQIIFNHDFAKSLAGDRWQEYLQATVVADNPIAALEYWL